MRPSMAAAAAAAPASAAPCGFVSLLSSCHSVRALKQLHARLLLLASAPFPYNHFLSKLLSLAPAPTAASHRYFLLLFSSHPSPSAFSFDLAIRASAASHPARSLRLLLRMLRSALPPGPFTLPSVLLAAARLPAPAAGRAAHALLEKVGLRQHEHTRHSLITMYASLGDAAAARKVFDGIAERDLVSWNAMVSGYVRMGMAGAAVAVFRRMVGEGWAPNGVTVVSVLAACGDAGDAGLGRAVEAWVRRAGMEVGSFIGSALVGMYEKCGELAEARRVFDGIAGKDVVLWNAMITGYAQNGMSNDAISLFRAMREAGVSPDKITLVGVLSACAAVGALELGIELDSHASRRGLYNNVYVGTALVDMYAKCGDLDRAVEVFGEMPHKNEASWNALICGLAFNGRGREAIEVFDRMRSAEGLRPDDITFIGVLSACVHAGLVEEGRRWFSSLTPEFGIAPRVEHYSCMVDLLARTGRLEEAWDLVNETSGKADAVMLGALLAACRKCRNADLGERVTARILQLEPANSWNYIVSSKMYASSARPDDAARMRELMRQRGVTKTPGCSWTEVDGRVHEFYAGDELLHGAEEECRIIMDVLADEMRLEGYVPNPDLF